MEATHRSFHYKLRATIKGKNMKDSLVGYVITEASTSYAKPRVVNDTGSVLTFDTVLQDYEPNRNRRIYPKKVIEAGIQAPHFQERLQTRTLLGESNHPFEKTPERQMVVDQLRACILITQIQAKDKVVEGRIETLATSLGKDLRGMIVENNSLVAFSMRGACPVLRPYGGKPGITEVCGPLHITTYDNVTYPSHKAAYMLTEGTLGQVSALHREAADHAGSLSENVRSIIDLLDASRAHIQLVENGSIARVYSDKGDAVVRIENHLARQYAELFK